MKHYSFSLFAPYSVETVWQWHETEEAFNSILPKDQGIQIISNEPGLHVGKTIHLRKTLGIFSLDWILTHTACDPYKLFCDEQLQGPFTFWKHTHAFKEANQGTLLLDDITFELPFSLLLTSWITKKINQHFQERHRLVLEELKKFSKEKKQQELLEL